MTWLMNIFIAGMKNLLAMVFLSVVVVGLVALYDMKLLEDGRWLGIVSLVSGLYLFICFNEVAGSGIGSDGGGCDGGGCDGGGD